jgi:NAD(P)-dependent dehydrogenase (short-subunit alcohol dehydrogenase family)
MLLENKNAIVYGAGGAIGGAVARAFAREGARVFLAGRTLSTLDRVAEEISAAEGVAETAQVDALDEQAVEKHVGEVVEQAGSIDVSFNAISIRDVQLTPLVEMSREDFMSPILTGATAHFLTARAAGRRMVEQGSGVILTLSTSAASLSGRDRRFHLSGGFGVACAAIEALTKQLAAELGPRGVRVVCLRPDAIPETWPDEFRDHVFDAGDGAGRTGAEVRAYMEGGTLLGRLPTLAEVANVAAFMASDRASAMTATVANISSGSVVD